jgi:hypothetical protein
MFPFTSKKPRCKGDPYKGCSTKAGFYLQGTYLTDKGRWCFKTVTAHRLLKRKLMYPLH